MLGTLFKEKDVIDISGLPKAKVLAALYNAAKPLGIGFLQYDPTPMSMEEANELIIQRMGRRELYFDYVKGRVMKVDLTSDIEFEELLYDRDNGPGKAHQVISALRKELT